MFMYGKIEGKMKLVSFLSEACPFSYQRELPIKNWVQENFPGHHGFVLNVTDAITTGEPEKVLLNVFFPAPEMMSEEVRVVKPNPLSIFFKGLSS